MGWIKFLFRWDGRIRGGQLLVWSMGAALVSTLASMVLVSAVIPFDPVIGGWRADLKFWTVWSVGQLPGWIATTSLTARRLHDLGRSAVWLIVFFAYEVGLECAVRAWPVINKTWVALVLILPAFAVVLWLIGAPGQRHDNRYGSVPT